MGLPDRDLEEKNAEAVDVAQPREARFPLRVAILSN